MKKLITLLFLIIVVFALAVGASALTLKSDAEQLSSSFSSFKSDLSSANYGAAVSSAKDTQSAISRLSNDLNSPIWDVVIYVPVVGHDVSNLRIIAGALDTLSATGISPVVDSLEALNDSGGSYTEKLAALQNLASAAENARTALHTCVNTIDSASDMNIPMLQEMLYNTRNKLSSVSGNL